MQTTWVWDHWTVALRCPLILPDAAEGQTDPWSSLPGALLSLAIKGGGQRWRGLGTGDQRCGSLSVTTK